MNETCTAKFQQLYKKIGQLQDVNAWDELHRKVMSAYGKCLIGDDQEKALITSMACYADAMGWRIEDWKRKP